MLLACLLMPLAFTACIGPRDRASLAIVEGDVVFAALGAPVRIERDAVGATRYLAGSQADVFRAQGFVHAQERLAQMDALRRFAAGRLAEFVGSSMLPTDRATRTMGMHLAADRAFAALSDGKKALLEAYADGVNAGIAALAGVPLEYRLLGLTPEAWEAADSVRAAYAMSAVLLTGHQTETRTAVLREALADQPGLADFLLPMTTRFDALVAAPNDYEPLPIPVAPAVSHDQTASAALVRFDEPEAAVGSNNWAVSGARTADGRAILAGDMHLALTMPPVWRHEEIRFGHRFAVGVALPGVPGIVAGSNGRIAWVFTNVTGDFADHAVITPDPDRGTHYLTPEGSAEFTTRTERIGVRRGSEETLVVKETSWGPVVGTDHRDRPLALRRADMDPEPINFAVLDFLTASTLEEGLDIASAWRGPPQNVVVADDAGRIGWTLSGYLPRRDGADGEIPLDFAAGETWDGAIDGTERPRLADPASGIIATANNRTVPQPLASRLGSQWELGGRAARIKERLADHPAPLTEGDLLDIQLDTRVRLYDAFVPHLLNAIEVDDQDRRLRYARRVLMQWDGRADADNRDYRLVRWACLRVMGNTVAPLLEPASKLDSGWRAGSPLNYAEPALRLLEEQPTDRVPEEYDSWRDLIRASVLSAMDDIRNSRDDRRLDAPWGERTRLEMRHPLSTALPWLRNRLDMPADPQPGDVLSVRVAAPSLGASQRLVVSPGREERGIFHMPGGQSGHPLSPFYRAGHDAWARGEARPLLPGPTLHRLTLTPRTETAEPRNQ